MKLIVNRELSGGTYYVNFSVGNFSPEEVNKMEIFGVPIIKMMADGPGNRRAFGMALNRISPAYKAAFANEDEAKRYADQVTTQIREAMQSLRERKDEFSSSEEVDL